MNTTTKPNRILYVTMAVLLAVLLIGAGGFLWLSSGGRDNPLGIGGPFTLLDGNGQTVTDKDFRGKYMLVYFGYTFCPDVCPTTLNAVADAMDKLGPAGSSIQPLFITVDPKRDTPAVVKQYTAAFGPKIEGLTGTPEEIAEVAKEYRVYYAEHRTGTWAKRLLNGPQLRALPHGPEWRFRRACTGGSIRRGDRRQSEEVDGSTSLVTHLA